METIIVLGILLFIGASFYSAGKSTGSRKGYGAGRWGRR